MAEPRMTAQPSLVVPLLLRALFDDVEWLVANPDMV